MHIRTYECAQTLSCTCAVAVREMNEVLILDMCDHLGTPHHIVRFAPGSDGIQLGEITADATGYSYTVRKLGLSIASQRGYYDKCPVASATACISMPQLCCERAGPIYSGQAWAL